MAEDNQNFHVGLKAFIQKGNRLLIVRESEKYKGGALWELPGGRIKESEMHTPLKDILLREVNEELGNTFQISINDPVIAFRRPSHPQGPVFLVGFDCAYTGGEVTISDEHMEFAWITNDEVSNYKFAEGFKEAILEYFKR